jgi:hypothetical protein
MSGGPCGPPKSDGRDGKNGREQAQHKREEGHSVMRGLLPQRQDVEHVLSRLKLIQSAPSASASFRGELNSGTSVPGALGHRHAVLASQTNNLNRQSVPQADRDQGDP